MKREFTPENCKARQESLGELVSTPIARQLLYPPPRAPES